MFAFFFSTLATFHVFEFIDAFTKTSVDCVRTQPKGLHFPTLPLLLCSVFKNTLVPTSSSFCKCFFYHTSPSAASVLWWCSSESSGMPGFWTPAAHQQSPQSYYLPHHALFIVAGSQHQLAASFAAETSCSWWLHASWMLCPAYHPSQACQTLW